MNDVKNEYLEDSEVEDSPDRCLLSDKSNKENSGLCCCLIIDDAGGFESPCDTSFESLCC